MPLWSHHLGLTGIADVVEFLDDGTPYPVEYKSGSHKPRDADDIQLCAQALCLEAMFDRPVLAGAIFHHASKRRRAVEFNAELRPLVVETTQQVRQLLKTNTVPPPVADQGCRDCSLIDACMPHALHDFERSSSLNNPFLIRREP